MAAKSGFITPTGTTPIATAGPDTGPGTFVLQANPANTGTYIYVGLDANSTVTATTGFSLSKTLGNQLRVRVGNKGLAGLYFLSDTAADDCMYMQVNGEGPDDVIV